MDVCCSKKEAEVEETYLVKAGAEDFYWELILSCSDMYSRWHHHPGPWSDHPQNTDKKP